MFDETMTDDSSHYEISLTAGQAFIAFVLLLLSLASSFAFGIMVGRGQLGDRLVVRREPAIVNEASSVIPKRDNEIVELGVPDEALTAREEFAEAVSPPVIINDAAPAQAGATDASGVHTGQPVGKEANVVAPATAMIEPVATAIPHFVQILSTGDIKTAEALAARLINDGFTSAYVERNSSDKGMIYRVRVKFASEAEARGSVERLKSYTSADVWVTKQ